MSKVMEKKRIRPSKAKPAPKTASALSGELITADEAKAIASQRALSNPKFSDRIGKGRKPGSKNKTTKLVKEFMHQCFEDIGGREAFAKWARTDRTEFYKMWSKMLGVEARSVVNINAQQMAFVQHPGDKDL